MGHYDQSPDQELIDELYHKSRAALEETATLRDQLAEAERTIAELRQQVQTRVALSKVYREQRDTSERTIGALKHLIGEIEDERGATIVRLGCEIEVADRERDEARRVAVWTLDEAQDGRLSLWKRCISWRRRRDGVVIDCGHDGTDESRYAALRRAMGESE